MLVDCCAFISRTHYPRVGWSHRFWAVVLSVRVWHEVFTVLARLGVGVSEWALGWSGLAALRGLSRAVVGGRSSDVFSCGLGLAIVVWV